MDSKFVTTSEGVNIAYQTYGEGPAVVLVHGFGKDKNVWLENGWVEALKHFYTVIIMDIRGWGESDKSYDPAFYAVEKITGDIEAVVGACGFENYDYIGHSYGATIGLQLGSKASKASKIGKIICAGTIFGDMFFKDMVPEWIKMYDNVNKKKKENRLEELELTEEDIEWAQKEDLDLAIAQLIALKEWPGVEPKYIQVPLAIYSGTNDTQQVQDELEARKQELEQYGIKSRVFDGLDHDQLICSLDVVMPWISELLAI